MKFKKIHILAGPGKIAVGQDGDELVIVTDQKAIDGLDKTKFSFYSIKEGYNYFTMEDIDGDIPGEISE